MKKLSIIMALAIASTSAIADAGCTESNPLGFYLSAEGHLKHVKQERKEGISFVMPGLGVGAGMRFCDYVGLETGFHMAKKKKEGYKYDHQGFTVQLMGYIPFDSFSFVGGLGFSHVRLQAKETADGGKEKDSRPIPRASLGFMIHHTDNISTRYMAAWEKSSSLGKKHEWQLKDSFHHQLGLVYTF
jgi:hypothetical protein